jgi:hypothetical protein
VVKRKIKLESNTFADFEDGEGKKRGPQFYSTRI